MRSLVFVPVSVRRSAWIGYLVALALVISSGFGVQASAAGQQANPQRLFEQDAGFIQALIRPDRTADFEMVMQKVKEALQKTENPDRNGANPRMEGVQEFRRRPEQLRALYHDHRSPG